MKKFVLEVVFNFTVWIWAAASVILAMCILAVDEISMKSLSRCPLWIVFALPYSFFVFHVFENRYFHYQDTCGKCAAKAALGSSSCSECGEHLERRAYYKRLPALVFSLVVLVVFLDNTMHTGHGKSYCSMAKSGLANYAISQEAYKEQNGTFYYGSNFAENLEGFQLSHEVKLGPVKKVKGPDGEDGFLITASHPECDVNQDGKPDVFTWDTTRGGFQKPEKKR